MRIFDQEGNYNFTDDAVILSVQQVNETDPHCYIVAEFIEQKNRREVVATYSNREIAHAALNRYFNDLQRECNAFQFPREEPPKEEQPPEEMPS